ncbi:hypothetical protein [Streptomyces sp. NPDC020742]|uniref:hypothetical protein n=1 Tax=Streptomyces sp. NPDC020742 TaxID=3154897 RepID=UPI00340D08E9
MPQPDRTDAPPPRIPAAFIRYAVALEAAELAWGRLNGRLTPDDTVELAFLRRCDLGAERGAAFARIHTRGPVPAELDAVCREIAGDRDRDRDQVRGPGGDAAHDPRRIWRYLELSWRTSRGGPAEDAVSRQLDEGRSEFLLARAASGCGMNWQESSALLGTDRPEEVDAAFARGEGQVGVAVIGLALTHPDAEAILPRVARALERARETDDPGLRHQGIVALAHTARLHGTVDRRCLDLLARCPRGNEADQDLWTYVARRRLPWWLWRQALGEWLWAWRSRLTFRG